MMIINNSNNDNKCDYNANDNDVNYGKNHHNDDIDYDNDENNDDNDDGHQKMDPQIMLHIPGEILVLIFSW